MEHSPFTVTTGLGIARCSGPVRFHNDLRPVSCITAPISPGFAAPMGNLAPPLILPVPAPYFCSPFITDHTSCRACS